MKKKYLVIALLLVSALGQAQDAKKSKIDTDSTATVHYSFDSDFFVSIPPIRRLPMTTCAYGLKATRPGRTDWDDEIHVLGSSTGWGAIGIGDARRSVASPADDRPGPASSYF